MCLIIISNLIREFSKTAQLVKYDSLRVLKVTEDLIYNFFQQKSETKDEPSTTDRQTKKKKLHLGSLNSRGLLEEKTL